jgi:signal transduction histidine kinase
MRNGLRSQLPLLWVDPLRMHWVIFNLLANAIRFAHKDPDAFAVEIAGVASRSGDYLIQVRDYGEGIRAGTEELIFKERIRASSTVGGDGLGLWIVRRIMEAHGGRVRVTSLRYPTEITLYLPESMRWFPSHLPALQSRARERE